MPSQHIKAAAAVVAIVTLTVASGIMVEAKHERYQIHRHAAAVTGGDPARGEAMFIHYGCGGCHALKHVRKAIGTVGPSLDGMALQVLLAGRVENSPDNLETWIRDPQRVSQGTAMPNLGVGERDARDISAFLYTRAE
jgi:cytochrome c